MLVCPMCKKTLADTASQCPRCRTDLSLLIDYVSHLDNGLTRAQELTRRGELADAVWAYLEVLEVDPDNAAARRQVGSVATAVRQFDRAQPGRRWLERLGRQARFRRWLHTWREQAQVAGWMAVAAVLLAGLTFYLGLELGRYLGPRPAPAAETAPAEPADNQP